MSVGISQIRILAVDDHPVVPRPGVAGLIGIQTDMVLVGEASNGRDAIQQFRTHHPDITLMDLQMPEMNGIDALIAIRNESPDAKVIVLTTYAGDTQILRALKARARPTYSRIRCTRNYSKQSEQSMRGRRPSRRKVYQVAEHATDDALTPAEILVLRLIAAGNANKQIADQLSITEETVKSRVKNILLNSALAIERTPQ